MPDRYLELTRPGANTERIEMHGVIA